MVLHQLARACYATISTFLLKNGYKRGTIDKTLFIKKDKNGYHMILLDSSPSFLDYNSNKKANGNPQQEVVNFLAGDLFLGNAKSRQLWLLLLQRQNMLLLQIAEEARFDGFKIQMHHFIRDAYEKKLIQVLKIHTDDNVADLLTKAFDVSSSIHYALTISPVISTTFVEQFWTSAKSQTINNVRYINAKVAGKPVTISEASIRSDLRFNDVDGIDSLNNQAIFDDIKLMGYEGDLIFLTFNKALFSPQWKFLFHTINHCLKDEGEGSERPSEPQPTPSPPHPSEAHVEPQSDPSPGPLPTIPIPDPIPKGFGRNHEKEPKQEEGLEDIKEEEGIQTREENCQNTSKGESTAQQQSTNRQDEGTDMQKVSSAKTKLSTDKLEEDTAEPEPRESSSSAAQNNSNTYSNTFEMMKPLLKTTSTRSVLTLKPLPKIDPNDKGKKRIEEDEESDTESEEITEAKKKFDQIAHDEEVARKIQEEWEAEEERKRLTEEEATKTALSNEYDFIQARIEADRLLAERALYEKVKRFDDSFITISSTKDERKIKEMNEEASDSNKKKKFVKEDVSAKVPGKARCSRAGYKERKGTIDSEIMERKSFISKLDKVSSPEGDYLVVYRVNGNFRIQLSNGGDFWNDQQDWEIVTGERMRLVEFGILEIRMKTIDMQR
ncbi:hypothetical protein Tco_0661814 [Tanacetum coccineum]